MDAPVQTGLERLLNSPKKLTSLRNARVALLANQVSVTRELDHSIDALESANVELTRLFGPEHGVRSRAQDMESVDSERDPVTGIPTRSLYGDSLESLRPNRTDLEDLDVVLVDLQDIGSRYYTYAYTLGLMMDACGQADTEVWVLDRPNPINGISIEGNIVDESLFSFVGLQPLATRHGMTMGELAHFFDRFGDWSCNLEVVKMRGWNRSMWFDQTGLPWVAPSPNMPTLETATIYPGMCLLEGTNCSEGRGTTRPFQLFGAPFVDARKLRDRLRGYDLPGARFRACAFRPMFQKHAGETCNGVELHVKDRASFRPVMTGFAVIQALNDLFDAFDWRTEPYEFEDDELAIDLLVGDARTRRALTDGTPPSELAAASSPALDRFTQRRQKCLLYEV